jgi:hypothetical protein
LFIKPEAMFYRETPLVSGPDLAQLKFTLTRPDKPAFNWVAPFETFSIPTYPDYSQGQLGGLAQVQALPFAYFKLTSTPIQPFPLAGSLPVSSGVVTLKTPTVFSWRSSASLPRCHYRWPVKDSISFEAHQQVVSGANFYQKSFGRIVPVTQIYRPLGKVRPQFFELSSPNPSRSLAGRDAPVANNISMAATLLRQHYDCRELPTNRDRRSTFRQVRHIQVAPVTRSFAKRAFNIGGIYRQYQPPTSQGWRSEIYQGLFKVSLVEFAQLQSGIQAGPLSFKERREREFNDRMGLWFTQKGIGQIEQSIAALLKTVVEGLPKFSKYVKVHMSNASLSFQQEHYSFGRAVVKQLAL